MFGSSFLTGGFLTSVGSADSSGVANPNLVPDKNSSYGMQKLLCWAMKPVPNVLSRYAHADQYFACSIFRMSVSAH